MPGGPIPPPVRAPTPGREPGGPPALASGLVIAVSLAMPVRSRSADTSSPQNEGARRSRKDLNQSFEHHFRA